MTNTVTVRPASAADATAVRELVADAGLPTAGIAEAWRTLVVEDTSTVLGTATLERYAGAEGPVYLLRSVAVRADHRAHGLGGALVRASLEAADADARGRAVVGLLTDNAVGYYDRFDFREVPRASMPPALAASPEFTTVCSTSAHAFLRN